MDGLNAFFRSFPLWRLVPRVLRDARAETLLKAGNAHEDGGQPEHAIPLYEAATQVSPDMARAHLNLGNALLATADHGGALRAYEAALQIDTGYADAYFNVGNVLARMGRLDAAVSAYERTVAIRPDFADAYVALGAALDDLQRHDLAIASYGKALAIAPDYAEVRCNLALSQRELGLFSEALANCRVAEISKPHSALVHDCLGQILKDLGHLDAAQACYRKALELEPMRVDTHSSLIFLLNYSDATDTGLAFAEAQRYGAAVSQSHAVYTVCAERLKADKRLRVGFVSGDLRSHPVSYFLEAVLHALANVSPRQIDIFCYANHFSSDAVTERIKSLSDGWCVVARLTDRAFCQRIREDSIDILIDLSGHTAHNRLPAFAYRPAPVQLSWLGYFGTTGLTTMDYVLADSWCLPTGEEANFTEEIWRLPDTRLCFTPPDVALEVGALPAGTHGLFTFGCFNNLSKMTAKVIAVWARVLLCVPDSQLFLKSPQLADPVVRRQIIEAYESHGVNAGRLVLEGLSSRADYLACYQRVDIALDPFPYTGGTTTAEALWMGVPVVTLRGEQFLARQGVGLLMNAGLPDWIASDQEDYVLRAARHAGDLSALANLRAVLRQQVLASPIFNATRFAGHLETSLRAIWIERCSKLTDVLPK